MHWKRPAKPRPFNRPGALSLEEQACARVALGVLRVRFGSLEKVATAMRINMETLRKAVKRGTVSAGVALDISRTAGVSFDDVITGRWPPKNSCPHCGHALDGDGSSQEG